MTRNNTKMSHNSQELSQKKTLTNVSNVKTLRIKMNKHYT